MASTAAGLHAAVLAEVQHAMDWGSRRFPNSHGPIDDGLEWDHDLQVTVEEGGWHTVTLTLTGTGHTGTLTLTGTGRFVEEFIATFGAAGD